MRKLTTILLSTMGMWLCGCVQSLNYSQGGNGATAFSPHTLAVLPVAALGNFDHDAASELIGRILPDELGKQLLAVTVSDPAIVKSQMANNEQLRDAVTKFILTLQTTGVADAGLSKKIGELLHADAFVFCDVSAYGISNAYGRNFGSASISIKIFDSASGNAVWSAGHRVDEPFMIVPPSMERLNRNLIDFIISFMPQNLPSVAVRPRPKREDPFPKETHY